MSAAISVLASDAPSAAASLYGTFDASNRDFVERHLCALAGNVVIDCTKATAIDDEAWELLEAFHDAAARAGRHVVIRAAPAPTYTGHPAQ